MQIISTFLPAEELEGFAQKAALMVFDTLVDQKGVVVGITVGKVQGMDLRNVRVSALGEQIIDRMGRHMALNYPNGEVVVAGVAQVAGAKDRVRQVLLKAPKDSAVLLVCANNKVYDAAFPALCVDHKSANMNQH